MQEVTYKQEQQDILVSHDKLQEDLRGEVILDLSNHRTSCLHLVCFAWIFFRADSMETACAVINQIKDHFTPEVFLQFVVGYKNVLALLLIGYLLHFTSHKQELRFRE